MTAGRRIPLPAPASPVTAPRLLAIVDVPTCAARGVDPVAALALVADAGAPAVMLRAKDSTPEERLALADQAVRYGRYGGAEVWIAADVEAASASGAAGVHLPSNALDRVAVARDAGLRVSAAVHDHGELIAALDAGVDQMLVAPVFDPTSKAATREALGLQGLAALCRSAGGVPVIALGGIGATRVGEVRAAGAYGVAALGPFCSEQGARAVREFRVALRRAFAVPGVAP